MLSRWSPAYLFAAALSACNTTHSQPSRALADEAAPTRPMIDKTLTLEAAPSAALKAALLAVLPAPETYGQQDLASAAHVRCTALPGMTSCEIEPTTGNAFKTDDQAKASALMTALRKAKVPLGGAGEMGIVEARQISCTGAEPSCQLVVRIALPKPPPPPFSAFPELARIVCAVSADGNGKPIGEGDPISLATAAAALKGHFEVAEDRAILVLERAGAQGFTEFLRLPAEISGSINSLTAIAHGDQAGSVVLFIAKGQLAADAAETRGNGNLQWRPRPGTVVMRDLDCHS